MYWHCYYWNYLLFHNYIKLTTRKIIRNSIEVRESLYLYNQVISSKLLGTELNSVRVLWLVRLYVTVIVGFVFNLQEIIEQEHKVTGKMVIHLETPPHILIDRQSIGNPRPYACRACSKHLGYIRALILELFLICQTFLNLRFVAQVWNCIVLLCCRGVLEQWQLQ